MTIFASDLSIGTAVLVPSAAMDAVTISSRAAASAPFLTPGDMLPATVGLTDDSDGTVRVNLTSPRPGLAASRWVHASHLALDLPDAPQEEDPTKASRLVSDALAAERRTRDAAIVDALVAARDADDLDAEVAMSLADALGVTLPSPTYTVEVEFIVRRTLTVTANTADARRALRSRQSSFVEQSLTWTGEAFETTDEDLTIDSEDGYEVEVNVTDLQQD